MSEARVAPQPNSVLGKDATRPDPRQVGAALKSGFTWSLANFIVLQAVSTAIFVVLARHLSPAVFGVFAMAALVVDFVTSQGKSAASDALLQRKAMDPESLSTGFWAVSGVCAGLFALSFPVAQLLAGVFHQAHLTSVLPALALAILLTPAQAVMEAIVVRQLEFKALAFRNMAGAVIGGVTGLAVLFSPFPDWALVAQRLGSIGSVVIFLYLHTRWRPMAAFKPRLAGALLVAGGQIWASQALSASISRVGDGIIGAQLGAVPLGLLRVAGRIVDTLHGPTTNPVMSLWVPVMSQISDHAASRRKMFLDLSQFAALVCVPAFLGLGLLGPDVTLALLPPAYAEAGPIIFWLSLIGLFIPLGYFRGSVLTAMSKNRATVVYSLIDILLMVGFTAGFAHYGLHVLLPVLVIPTAISSVAATAATLHATGVRLRAFVEAVFPAYLAAGVMVLTVAAVRHELIDASVWLRMAAAITAGAAAYAVWLLLFHRTWVKRAASFILTSRKH